MLKKNLFVSGNVERQINTVEALSGAISKIIERNSDDIQLVKYRDVACNDFYLGNVLQKDLYHEYQEYLRGNPTNYDPFLKAFLMERLQMKL